MVWNLLKITMFDEQNVYSFLLLKNDCKLSSPGNLEILQNCLSWTNTTQPRFTTTYLITNQHSRFHFLEIKKFGRGTWTMIVANIAILHEAPPPTLTQLNYTEFVVYTQRPLNIFMFPGNRNSYRWWSKIPFLPPCMFRLTYHLQTCR